MDKDILFTTSEGSSPRHSNSLVLQEIVRAEVYRYDGRHEELETSDMIVNVGRNYIARRIVGNDSQTSPGSAMAYMSIGTGTTGTSLASTLAISEIIARKALSLNSAGVTAANVYTAVATYGGSADAVTSLSIAEASIWNHASSGQGTMMQNVNFTAVVLANSDLLKITLETNVGSS